MQQKIRELGPDDWTQTVLSTGVGTAHEAVQQEALWWGLGQLFDVRECLNVYRPSTYSEDTVCAECGESVSGPMRGPHRSVHVRSAKAKYRYLDGDTKHPYEFKACKKCGEEKWIQTRNDFCSYKCSKLGDLNPSWSGGRSVIGEDTMAQARNLRLATDMTLKAIAEYLDVHYASLCTALTGWQRTKRGA